MRKGRNVRTSIQIRETLEEKLEVQKVKMLSSSLNMQLLCRSKVAEMPGGMCLCLKTIAFPTADIFPLMKWNYFLEAKSCQMRVRNVSTKSPAVQKVKLEALSVPHMPQNQRDKLLIASGHLSVRVRPSVAQRGWAIPHSTVPPPPTAVGLNGCRRLKATARSLSHALSAVCSNTWRTPSNTPHPWQPQQHPTPLPKCIYWHGWFLGQKIVCWVLCTVVKKIQKYFKL